MSPCLDSMVTKIARREDSARLQNIAFQVNSGAPNVVAFPSTRPVRLREVQKAYMSELRNTVAQLELVESGL